MTALERQGIYTKICIDKENQKSEHLQKPGGNAFNLMR